MAGDPRIVKLKNTNNVVAEYFLVDIVGAPLFGTLTHTEGHINDTARFRAAAIFYPMSGDTYGIEESRFDRNTYFLALFEKPIRVSALGSVTSMVVKITGDGVNKITWDNSSVSNFESTSNNIDKVEHD